MRSNHALLIAAGGGIGDTLVAGVVAHALRKRYDAVDALVLPAHVPVAAHNPVYASVAAFEGGVAALAARLRTRDYRAAIVTWASGRTALVPFLARIPQRVGQSRRLYSALFTERVDVRSERGDRTTPWAHILLDYARALGCDEAHPQPVFVPDDADRAAAARIAANAGVPDDFLIVHPTRGIDAVAARWPIDGFVTLARELAARYALPVLVSGHGADAPVAERIAAAAGPAVRSIAGATSLGAYGALAARARAVVAMDSGPMHVAAATGAPTVGVFALQTDEPLRWAPIGPRVAVVRGDYPCPPSHRKETCPDFPCVRELPLRRIVAAVDELTGGPGGANGTRRTVPG